MTVASRGLIAQFARGPSKLEYSSALLGWTRFYLEQHWFAAGERPQGHLDGTLLCFWTRTNQARSDHLDVNGNLVPKVVPPEVFSLYTEGPLAPVNIHVPTHGLFCIFDAGHFAEAIDDIRRDGNMYSIADGVVLQDKRCFTDDTLKTIVKRLAEEASNGNPNGYLYADEYIQRFLDHLATLISTRGHGKWVRYDLDDAAFKRLCELIYSTQADQLSLAILSADSGCSERQLLRSFRAKTGRTPYQYLLDLRLEKARRLMLKPHLSLVDIALECGFANHGHFTRAFRQRIGMKPSEYRKRLY